MSRLISIECDPTEVRVAIGSSGLTSGVTLEHVLSSPLSLDASEDVLGSVKTFQAVQGLLKQAGVRSGNAIVCVGRNAVELRSMTLPTVDKNELPEMVRFAAQRQFANTGDSWPIDFVVIPSNQDKMTDCLAATINPAIVDRIGKIVESLGLTLTQIVLRPLASATMAMVKQSQLANSNVLFMELFRDEVDMTIVERGNVVFMRNVRFSQPLEGAVNHQALLSEIKRTLIAAASQRTNLEVDQIRVWGSDSQYSETCKHLSASLKNNVATIDALDLVDASRSVRGEAGDNPGKFSSAVGALFAPQVSDRLIDFSHPRKREEKQRPVRTYALAGAAVALILGSGFAWYWSSHSAMNQEIAELEKDIASNVTLLKTANKKISDWRKVEVFMEGDYNWLEQLEYLSSHAAPADKVIFGATSFMVEPRTNSSTISTRFITIEQDDVPEIQEAYRDPQHSVRTTGVNKTADKKSPFPTSADLTIRIAPQKAPDPRKSATAKRPADNKPEAKPTEPAQTLPSPSPAEPESTKPNDPAPPASSPEPKTSVGGA
jgi:hypothetical protein